MTIHSVTVIICTRNRAEDLALTLQNIALVDIPPGKTLELIVVNNNSTDHTNEVIELAKGSFDFDFHSVFEEKRGLSSARNCGLRKAAGEIVIFTDDDCIVSKDWIVQICKEFEQSPPLDVLGGRIELFDKAHLPLTILTSKQRARMGDLSFPGGFVLGCNMAFRRSILHRIGFFDKRFGAGTRLKAGEDADFIYRAYRAGCQVAYSPDVVLYHNHKRTTAREGYNLQRNYSYSDGAFLMKHAIDGDLRAAKWLYWRMIRSISDIPKRPLSLKAAWRRAVLAADLVRGTFGYLLSPRAASWHLD